MFKPKIVVMIALIVFAMGILLAGDVVAGEKVKRRSANYVVKSEAISVPDEEGHIVLIAEQKGINTMLEGGKLLDGTTYWGVGLTDMNTKTGLGSTHGYGVLTDRDGDKVFQTYEGKSGKPYWSGTFRFVRGTGKFEGIKGNGTWISLGVAPNQSYVDSEAEIEWPAR